MKKIFLIILFIASLSNGQVLVDISGNGNNGTIYGASSTKDGMSFDGVDDYVDFNDISLTDFTTEFRFRKNNIASNMVLLGDASNSDWLRLNNDANSTITLKASGSSTGTASINTGFGITNEVWHHLVVTSTDKVLNYYLNGVKSAVTATATNGIFVPEFIGQKASVDFFNGQMDFINIYNRALTEAEIVAKYNATIETVIWETFNYD